MTRKPWISLAGGLLLAAVAGAAWTWGTHADTMPCSEGATTLGDPSPATYESRLYFDGTATASGDTRSFRFCGEDTVYLFGFVNWKGNKDLSVTLVAPDGSTHFFDAYSTVPSEHILLWGPLAHGDWQITVANKGSGRVSYHAALEFR